MTTGRPLAGRTAVVTGASRGIGAAVARRLGASGARVVLLARNVDALRAVAAEIGSSATVAACDLAEPAHAADATRAALGRIGVDAPDILVNNAAAFFMTPAHETTVDAFREMLELNLTAPFAFVRAFLPAMRARGTGHLVTIGSIADRVAFPGNAAYAASKFGLRALHEVLRAELKGSGVRASLVSPGPVDTPLWDAVESSPGAGAPARADMLSADDVAAAVRFVVEAPATLNVDELRLSHS